MSREVKFRGKRVDNGEWVYGCLLEEKSRFYSSIMVWIDEFSEFDEYEVIPEAIGQYTGLKDKNGVEIYEGDIISLETADGETITVVCKFGQVQRQIYNYLVEIKGFYFIRSSDGRKTFPVVNNYIGKHDTEIWEVIGNIHDNPELMEGKP